MIGTPFTTLACVITIILFSRINFVVVFFSDRHLRRIDCLPKGISPSTLLLSNNEISKVENLQYFANLQQVRLSVIHVVTAWLVNTQGMSDGQKYGEVLPTYMYQALQPTLRNLYNVYHTSTEPARNRVFHAKQIAGPILRSLLIMW